MFISLVITFGLMLCQGVTFSWHIILVIPILIVLYIVSFGIGMILMNLGVTLNDLSNLTNIFLRMIFYFSGVFYNISERLTGSLKFILLKLNPAAFIMNELRNVLLNNSLPDFTYLLIWLVVGILLCLIGIHMIHKNENSYAKVI
jgi:ABC-type polysaccharide/polyol phosphate export permease